MPKRSVFVTRALPEAGLRRLNDTFDVSVAPQDEPIATEALRQGLAHAWAVVPMLTDRIDAALLDAAPGLRVVANYAAGTNNIDLAACKARGITVCNTPGVLSEATAELAMGLILDCFRGLSAGDRGLRAGDFKGWAPLYRLGRGLRGKHLGLVGFGRIGREVARLAQAFGMDVAYTQRHRLDLEEEQHLGVRFQDLDQLTTRSDAISLHCPLSPETQHLFDAGRLANMKPGAILVNTARGPVVDEAALVQALKKGPLAAAGLDVFEKEPEVHPGLLNLPNALLVPHLGSATIETREAMAALVAENLELISAGKPGKTEVK